MTAGHAAAEMYTGTRREGEDLSVLEMMWNVMLVRGTVRRLGKTRGGCEKDVGLGAGIVLTLLCEIEGFLFWNDQRWVWEIMRGWKPRRCGLGLQRRLFLHTCI
jgi:hypothetical protein